MLTPSSWVMTTTTMDLIHAFFAYLSITVTLTESNTFENQRIKSGGYIYPDRLGFLQCQRLCCRYGGCGAVSYLTEHCLCELHGLHSGQSDMSFHSGCITWTKKATEEEPGRECVSPCRREEKCLITRKGEFKCVPTMGYHASERHIPSNMELKYLDSWGISKEQACGKHNDKKPWNVTNIPLRDKKTSVYYTLIHVQQNKTIYNPDTDLSRHGQNIFFKAFSVKYYYIRFITISLNEKGYRIWRREVGDTFHSLASTLNTTLQMDIGVLFNPMETTLSSFLLKFGNYKFTSFDYREIHTVVPLSVQESFCLPFSSADALNPECGLGVSAKILPFEESNQYQPIWENALKSFFNKEMSRKK